MENRTRYRNTKIKPKSRTLIVKEMAIRFAIYIIPFILLSILAKNYEDIFGDEIVDSNTNTTLVGRYFPLWLFCFFWMFVFIVVSIADVMIVDSQGDRAFAISGKISFIIKPIMLFLVGGLYVAPIGVIVRILITLGSIITIFVGYLTLGKIKDTQIYYTDWFKTLYKGNSEEIDRLINSDKITQKHLISGIVLCVTFMFFSVNFEKILFNWQILSKSQTIDFGYLQIGLLSTIVCMVIAIAQVLLCWFITYTANLAYKKRYLVGTVIASVFALLVRNFIDNALFFVIFGVLYTIPILQYYQLLFMSNPKKQKQKVESQ